NLFYFTHPHKTWITYQERFDDPTWFAFSYSQIPQDIKADRTRLMAFSCLAKGSSCVVELRNCRLIEDAIRVDKPFLTTPNGWPRAETKDGALQYRTPYFVKNVSDQPMPVAADLVSKHEWFGVKVEPAQATI